MASDCPYRLYVYKLQAGWRRNGRADPKPLNLKTRALNELNGHPYIDSVVGANFLPYFPKGVKLWNSGQFSTAEIVYRRVLQHRCRTDDPLEADLFFVPAWSIYTNHFPTSHCAISYGRNAAQAISGLYDILRNVPSRACNRAADGPRRVSPQTKSTCSALEAHGGADHILITPRNGAPLEVHPMCELDYADARLGAATRLAIEEPSHDRWKWFDHYATVPLFSSLPHVSNLHLDEHAEHAPWRVRHPRHLLAVAAFGVGHGNRENIQIRHRLQRMCVRAAPADCTFLSVWERMDHAKFIRTNRSATSETPTWLDLSRLYWNATFCLQPPGGASRAHGAWHPACSPRAVRRLWRRFDGCPPTVSPLLISRACARTGVVADAVSRKGVLDALVLGCIPVLFHEGLALQWPDHWGEWQASASVVFDWRQVMRGKLDVIAALRAMPAARVSEMQRAIARNAHRVHFAAVDTSRLPRAARPAKLLGADAVDVLLEAAARRSKEPSLIATGRQRQRTEGRKVDAVAEALRASVEAINAREASGEATTTDEVVGREAIGYCGHAGMLPGNCHDGSEGRLPLRNTSELSVWGMRMVVGLDERASFEWPANVQPPATLDECAAFCRTCERCNYVSYNMLHKTCEWYHSCNGMRDLINPVKRMFGGEHFVTRRVKSNN